MRVINLPVFESADRALALHVARIEQARPRILNRFQQHFGLLLGHAALRGGGRLFRGFTRFRVAIRLPVLGIAGFQFALFRRLALGGVRGRFVLLLALFAVLLLLRALALFLFTFL